ncbi:MAG: hypothetical protein ACYDCO_04665 [Armatimonadota bacterium]
MKSFYYALLCLLLLAQLSIGAFARPGGAELYYRETLRILDAVEKQMPVIQQTADQAAAIYVARDDLGIGADGVEAFLAEPVGRSGGIMAMGGWWPIEKPQWKGVMLYCLREGMLADDLQRIAAYRERGSVIVLFGRPDLLEGALKAGVEPLAAVPVPADPRGGLFRAADGQWVVPTYEMAAMCTVWPWVGEFVAACTRRGKTPVMFQSVAVPTGYARIEQYTLKEFTTGAYAKWHDESVPAVRAGKLGKEWLRMARKRLGLLHRRELAHIRLAAERAAQARQAGKRLFVFRDGHGQACLWGVPHDPGYFIMVPGDWQSWIAVDNPNARYPLQPGDFVLSVGYHSIFNDEQWHFFADHLRKGRASTAWIAASYKPEAIRTLPGEIFIDAQWEYGDADVTLPGYDVKILPTSGILGSAAYLMILAEVHQRLSEKRAGED